MIRSVDPVWQKAQAVEELSDALKRAYDVAGITAGLRITPAQMALFCEENGFLEMITMPEVLTVNDKMMIDHCLNLKYDRAKNEYIVKPSDVTYHDMPVKHIPKI